MAIQLLLRRSVVAVLLIISFVLQGTTSVLAGTTGTITGSVVDASTNQPVPSARVTAQSPSQTLSTTADGSGKYTFLSLAPDTYTITAAASSKYDSASLSGVTVVADQSQTVMIAQPSKLKVIGSVTSRAASSLVKPGTTADVYSISATQQDKVSALGGGGNLNSAWSAIASVPGVFIAPNQAGYIGAGSTISIRGGDYDQIGYEFDGVPVNRAFDNYPSGPASSLGQQELQVYTGANPANSEGQGISGYINQVIRTGTYPGTKTAQLAIGGPSLYNKVAFETGGATPSRSFSYYLGFGQYNQNFRYADNFNGASLNSLAGAPLNTCPGGPENATINRRSLPSCYGPGGQDYTNGGLTPAYVLGPYMLGFQSNVFVRDSIVNLHFAIPRKDGSRDDVQLLWDNNAIGSQYYTSTNDQGGVDFLNNANVGQPVFIDGLQYNGPTGGLLPTVYNGAGIVPYQYPQSPNGRVAFDNIPVNFRDGIPNNQGIVKLQYQRNFGTSAFLRVYGYTYYSDWLQVDPQTSYFNFIGPGSPDYELSSHTRGVSAMFSDQINSQHLLSIQGSYTTSRTLRDNNTQMFDGSGRVGPRSVFAALVDSSNPYNGICYTAPAVAVAGRGAAAAGAPTTCSVDARLANFLTLAGAQGGAATPSGTCGAGSCAYLIVGNGQYATYNTVKPKFTSFSITDQWKPTEKLNLNIGLRFDRFQFDGSDTTNSLARTFWYNAFNLDNCVDSQGALHDKVAGLGLASPNSPCPAGYSAINVTNPHGVVTEAYNNLQPRIGATYTLDPRSVLRASYGRYVQAPNSAFQQYDTLQANSPYALYRTYNFQRFGFTTPNHTVRPPVSNNYDFSYEHQFKGDTAIKLTPFLRKTQDQIQQFFLDQKTNFVSGLNVGRQTSQGFELEIDKGDFSRDGIAAKLSYTYTNSYINYNKLPNGTYIVDPINQQIEQYNAYTSFCASSPTDIRCGQPTATTAGAQPCYNPAGGGGACGGANTVANPYWNANVQPLLSATANYATYDVFPGGIGSSYQSYGAPHVLTGIFQWKKGQLAVTPSFQFIAGQRYGAPLTTPGVAPDTCAALASAAAGDPRYRYGAPGGNGYDAYSCGQLQGGVPNFYTGHFDQIGEFRSPSQFLLNTQISYNATRNITLVGTLANIVNRCFGGTGPSGQRVSGACNYSTFYGANAVGPIGNVRNPGDAIQPYVDRPYYAQFAGFPFQLFVEARVKL